MNLQILKNNYFEEYSNKINVNLPNLFKKISAKNTKKNIIDANYFEYYLQSSATYSSNIEGNSIDFDSFLKNKYFEIKSKPKEMAEIEDLIVAYNFAMNNKLNSENMLETHKIMSKNVLSAKKLRGKFRDQQVGIFSGGKIEYLAVESEFVSQEMNKFFADIDKLINKKLTYKEIFYYASIIHLTLEKIHPFMDCNGRVGRLLEKWFIAEKLGCDAWLIQSEKHYFLNKNEYYKNIHIGVNYYYLHWEKCVPFLLMLIDSIK
jgi:Fic family protein